MNSASSFTQSDIKHYRRLRALSKELNQRIVKTIPRKAFYEIGKAIGVERDGQLWFESEHITSVLMDCCLYDWIVEGKNLVQRYAEDPSRPAGTDEDYLLQAYLRAQYRILVPRAVLPGAGVSVVDALSGDEIFVMDTGLSQSSLSGGMRLATRTIPLEKYSITGGAALPLDIEAGETVLRRLTNEQLLVDGTLTDPHRMALLVVRACLQSGATQHVRYDDWGTSRPRQSVSRPRHVPRTPGRNDPCPCGSGKKYKKCCGAH